jgi:hypothetical protein
MNLSARLRKLESLRDTGTVHVVQGYSDAEHDAGIAELISTHRATPDSLFVCIMKFGDRNGNCS